MTVKSLMRVPDSLPVHTRIWHARRLAGLAKADVARALELSVSTYERIESGVRVAKRGELLVIADVVGQPRSLFLVDEAA